MAVCRRLRKTYNVPEKGVGFELLFTNPSQAIDPAAEIDCLHRHQGARLRCGLDNADSHNVRLRPARSGPAVPFQWMRNLHRGPSNSIITHRRRCDQLHKRGPGHLRCSWPPLGLADSASGRSLPYSRCKTSAVRHTPCSLANSVAALHRRSGIGWAANMGLPPALEAPVVFPHPYWNF